MSALSDEAVGRLRAVANWPELGTDRYLITTEIGRGGMGTVYAATDAELGREVALKVSNTVAGAAFESRLAAEARVLARLEHPGIVPIHDAGRLADGRPFYVMKRITGRTLSEQIVQGIEAADRLRIFERICETVSFAHARGVVHRDLKPDNVMIGAFGEVMVLDWGVARALAGAAEELVTPGIVLGTHGFMAPEQARGETDAIDQRADVYSLGVILLALLSGEAAPVAATASAEASILRFPSIPSPLRSICRRALAAHPSDRYPSAAALGDDVTRYRAGHAVLAHRETLFERIVRIASVYRTPILLVLAYMVMRALVAFVTGH